MILINLSPNTRSIPTGESGLFAKDANGTYRCNLHFLEKY
jgi:hypothetical protein